MKGKMYESEFEEVMVTLLKNCGWDYKFGGSLEGRKVTDALIESELRRYVRMRYADKGLREQDIQTILSKLRNVSGATDYLSLRAAYMLYTDGFVLQPDDKSKEPFRFEYIDFDHVGDRDDCNCYLAVNQFEMEQGRENRRPDIMLFVNGIPLCIIELKNPADEKATIYNAWKQICVRYKRDIPLLMKYCALSVISDGSNTRLGTTYTDYEYYYAWKKVLNEDAAESGVGELDTMVRGALSPERLLSIVRDFVYFPDITKDSASETEIVCRYPQYFATQRLRDNIVNHLRSNGGDGKGGHYFGATGCGKTYTMLFLARQLTQRCKMAGGSPTILIIVDREDLETQSGKLFCKSKDYLCDNAVKVFDNREQLQNEMTLRKSGGVFITTIQKFTSETGLLSDRGNIICMSDEAHRTQNNTTGKTVVNVPKDEVAPDKLGAYITYGFAKYLRDALPNATYVGFTGTPIDEVVAVFGGEVDRYTMKQAQEDGITVPIKYEARLARVFLKEEEAKAIESYYKQCEEEGNNADEVDKSKRAMSSMEVILEDDDVLDRMANDFVQHYEHYCSEHPELVQKAMVVCCNRVVAFKMYKKVMALRPEWVKPMKYYGEYPFGEDDYERAREVPMMAPVATRNKDDAKEMYDLFGDKDYRSRMDSEFKDDKSNFRVAIVVDMWITGFDVPSLGVMYNCKPLQKHTLIQTISRVNRKYKSKECGLIVDYIGIRENMKKAMKQYGGDETTDVDIAASYSIFENELDVLKKMLSGLYFENYFVGDNLSRLTFLQVATEFILQRSEQLYGQATYKDAFRGHVKRMRSAYALCAPAGMVTDDEFAYAQCIMAISSYMNKIAPPVDLAAVDKMNKRVETMVKEALLCSGVETVLGTGTEEEIFGEAFLNELDDIKMPHTKFQILVSLIEKTIKSYKAVNKVRAEYFEILLQRTVDDYNDRDKLQFTTEVVGDTLSAIEDVITKRVEALTENLKELLKDLQDDRDEFKRMGISFEEKAFYDILVDIRDREKFEYDDERCIALAKEIKTLVDGSAVYADWLNNRNIRADLNINLLKVMVKMGYPPEWNDMVFERVLEQVENYKYNERGTSATLANLEEKRSWSMAAEPKCELN